MLAKLLATLSRRGSHETHTDHQPAKLLPEALQFKPMVPLRPPPAQNDDVMQKVCDEVERALRASGHLR